jgi:hypothetical protein
MADTAEEVAALEKRYREAEAELRARGCLEIGQAFEAASTQAKAGIGRAMSEVLVLAGSPTSLYASFYMQIAAGTRMPDGNEFDLRRESIDSRFFPSFHKEIVFGALTLDGRGVEYYGGVTMILRDDAIAERATVFHENTFLFVDKRGIKYSDPFPPGYRADWKNRGMLALAKLHAALDGKTQAKDFPGILLRQKTTTSGDDFVEVHIFQGFSRGAIEKIICTKPRNKFDTHELKVLREKAAKAGIAVEVV